MTGGAPQTSFGQHITGGNMPNTSFGQPFSQQATSNPFPQMANQFTAATISTTTTSNEPISTTTAATATTILQSISTAT